MTNKVTINLDRQERPVLQSGNILCFSHPSRKDATIMTLVTSLVNGRYALINLADGLMFSDSVIKTDQLYGLVEKEGYSITRVISNATITIE